MKISYINVDEIEETETASIIIYSNIKAKLDQNIKIDLVVCKYCLKIALIIKDEIKICYGCKENPIVEFDSKGEFK